MNRRSFLKTTAAAIALAMVPSWLTRQRKIDLAQFTSKTSLRFDLANPFVQESDEGIWSYATDAKICIRVPGDQATKGESVGQLPPANSLPWKDELAWKSWPKNPRMLDDNAMCLECDGEGFVCVNGNALTCQKCHGYAIVLQPCVVPIQGAFVSRVYHDKILKHLGDAEYCVKPYRSTNIPQDSKVVAIRGDGWEGLLMPRDKP